MGSTSQDRVYVLWEMGMRTSPCPAARKGLRTTKRPGLCSAPWVRWCGTGKIRSRSSTSRCTQLPVRMLQPATDFKSARCEPCKSPNVTIQAGGVCRSAKEAILKQKGCVVWFTGLSGSGKSTVALEVERLLAERGILTALLDGDNLRHGLCCDLGFSKADREENIRRCSEVAKLFVENGVITLCCFISPYSKHRDEARGRVSPGDFVEVYVRVRTSIQHELALTIGNKLRLVGEIKFTKRDMNSLRAAR